MGETYEGAGVSIEAGDEAVRRIGPLVKSTYRPEVLSSLGGFGGLFDVSNLGYEHPVLVSTTDGVGTKAVVASQMQKFDTIGLDLVAMCVDDLVCQGAQPLFFLDYVAIGKLVPDQIEQLVGGIAEGCRQAGCALIGGEMAEHPGVLEPGDFDLVGFAVGAADRDHVITGEMVGVGDVLIGLPSPNLRSNGFSLARRVLFDVAGKSLDDRAFEGASNSLGEELLEPSVIYSPAVLAAIAAGSVHTVAHVTGGGLAGNLERVLPGNADARVDSSTWETPRIFSEIQHLGDVSDDEMQRVFNMGVGMVLAVAAEDASAVMAAVAEHGHQPSQIGEVVIGTGKAHVT